MTLYRKYRPQIFSDIVAQEHVKRTLTNAVTRDLVSHAYLFTGPRGTGKTSTARILAKVLNCENIDDKQNPCNACDTCQKISEGSLIDIIEIDAASNRGIDEIRELKQTLQFRPSFVKRKIYIIDEVHMLTKEAFNALLKTLEEPPDYVYFVLATTEVEKIPETIISRCQRFDFRRVSVEAIADRLLYICKNEKIKADKEALIQIAEEAEGGLRDAISLLEQLSSLYDKLGNEEIALFLGRTEESLCQGYIDKILNGELNEAMTIVDRFISEGYQIDQVYKDLLSLLRKHFLKAVESGENIESYLQFVELLERNYNLFHKSAIPQLLLEVTAAMMVGSGQQTTAKIVAKTEVKKESSIEQNASSAPAQIIEQANEIRKHNPISKPEVKSDILETTDSDLSLKDLKKKWQKINDKIPLPALRVALKQAQIENFDGSEVVLAFASAFNRDQANHAVQIAEIEKAINSVLGRALVVKISDKLVDGVEIVAKQDESKFVASAMDMFADL